MSPAEFFKLPADVAARDDLTSSAKIVYAVIVDHFGNNGHSWPGVRCIGQESGLHPGTVSDCVHQLEQAGLVKVERSTWPRPRNTYRLANAHVRRMPTCGKSVRAENADATCGKPVQNQTNEPDQSCRHEKPPADPRVREFIDWFVTKHLEATGRKYIVAGGKDGKLVKTLLAAIGLGELQRAAAAMLSDPWGRDKADVGLLSSQINRWTKAGTPGSPSGEDALGQRNLALMEAQR
ncbi:MAG: helix-turn-helix domain-containing protein [Planctomycetota bacterium]